jgi:predicted nucleotidyltransferase
MSTTSIDPAFRAEIETRLCAIEAEHGVRILYACESGSRGWDSASPDSDYDVRFLYAHPLAWYLRVMPGRDVIELPISETLDINGWELRKALQLLRKGNATLIEWLDSPISYRADAAFLRAMRHAAQKTWQPERAFHHYLHMARGNYREYLRGETVRYKKYLYVLRPLLAAQWIIEEGSMPPMRFQDLVEKRIATPALRQAIDTLLARKRASAEAEYCPVIPLLNDFIDAQFTSLTQTAPPARTNIDFSPLDEILMQAVLAREFGGRE